MNRPLLACTDNDDCACAYCRAASLESQRQERALNLREDMPLPAFRRQQSTYLYSSIVFTLSSFVAAGVSVASCVTDGFSSSNIAGLVSNVLYVGAYVLYVRAEWQTPLNDALPMITSPMIQRI